MDRIIMTMQSGLLAVAAFTATMMFLPATSFAENQQETQQWVINQQGIHCQTTSDNQETQAAKRFAKQMMVSSQ
ncbi:hypothetical protein [Erwinia mallotivora]|uniref:hypothetical protein n=1 Tax=Erwinia mallotivora TaxID=69222 RepID=UPI0021C123C9|nr:hypothetical protein [Erwinia mallotivora]